MFEGTYTLLEVLKERIDYLVLIISPKMRTGLNAIAIEQNFKVVHENYIGKEKIVYLKRLTL